MDFWDVMLDHILLFCVKLLHMGHDPVFKLFDNFLINRTTMSRAWLSTNPLLIDVSNFLVEFGQMMMDIFQVFIYIVFAVC